MDGELITEEKKRKMKSEMSIENASFEVNLFARSGPQIVLVVFFPNQCGKRETKSITYISPCDKL